MDFMAFAITFDVIFAHPEFAQTITLSTGIDAPLTHWKHINLWFESINTCKVNTDMKICGNVIYKRNNSNNRQYNIEVFWEIKDNNNNIIQDKKYQSFLIR